MLRHVPPGTTIPRDRKPVHTGGCQCGVVRYALYAEPLSPYLCHCRMCQKAVGNYFAAYALLMLSDLAWTRGKPAFWRSSEQAERGFCRECGTPLTYRRVAVDRISVTVGSLDQPYDFPSEVQYGIENRPHFADRIAQGEGITSAQSTARAPGNYATRQHPDHDTPEWPPTRYAPS